MGLMQRVVKPRNQRSKRALDAREPKAIENDKATIFVRGQKCSETVKSCMKDFHSLKRPNAVMVRNINCNVCSGLPETVWCYCEPRNKGCWKSHLGGL